MEKRGVNPQRSSWKRRPQQKKKWVDHPVYVATPTVEKYVNPMRKRANGEVRSPIGGKTRKGGVSTRRRRKQERRHKRADRRSLRWLYGEKRGTPWKKERATAKARLEKERKKDMTVKGWVQMASGERSEGNTQAHRRNRMEVRMEVRRWRAGRVETLAQAKERMEKGKVYQRTTGGEKRVVTEGHQRRSPGEGRKIEEDTWKWRKGKRVARWSDPQVAQMGLPYAQVDYVSGRRWLVRLPKSEEVMIAKGTRFSKYC